MTGFVVQGHTWTYYLIGCLINWLIGDLIGHTPPHMALSCRTDLPSVSSWSARWRWPPAGRRTAPWSPRAPGWPARSSRCSSGNSCATRYTWAPDCPQFPRRTRRARAAWRRTRCTTPPWAGTAGYGCVASRWTLAAWWRTRRDAVAGFGARSARAAAACVWSRAELSVRARLYHLHHHRDALRRCSAPALMMMMVMTASGSSSSPPRVYPPEPSRRTQSERITRAASSRRSAGRIWCAADERELQSDHLNKFCSSSFSSSSRVNSWRAPG